MKMRAIYRMCYEFSYRLEMKAENKNEIETDCVIKRNGKFDF